MKVSDRQKGFVVLCFLPEKNQRLHYSKFVKKISEDECIYHSVSFASTVLARHFRYIFDTVYLWKDSVFKERTIHHLRVKISAF